MKLAFTLCSNNYLAQAKVLGDSFKKHHPKFEFIIGLVDTFHPLINYQAFSDFTLIEVSKIKISDFKEMEEKYNIVELNTAVKPFFFSYLFLHFDAEKIIYLDPDIEVFTALDEAISLLDDFNIVITPQNCVPIDDGNAPSDIQLLGAGIFNLGFIALSNYKLIEAFLGWWTERLIKYAFSNERDNMFYDQLWINLVPAFFDNYFILKHPGYNMAPSNLHERKITNNNEGMWEINNIYMLRFYHYSGYKYLNPDIICSYSTRYTFETRKDILPLYTSYLKALKENNIIELLNIQPHYCKVKKTNANKFKRGYNRISRALNVLLGRA